MLDHDFHLATPRLFISHLIPTNDAHCDFIYDLMLSPGIAKEMPAADVQKAMSVPPRDAGRKFIADCVGKMEKTGHGRYLISLKPTLTSDSSTPGSIEVPFSQRQLVPIGVVSMQHARFPSAPSAPTIPDVGFGLLSRYFRNGYATEAATALLKYFKEEKGQTEFCAFCRPDNEASKNALARLGFEARGFRGINGVVEGELLGALVWTMGVGKEESALEARGL
jgi:RimJ/RimL family protein N-acetyltransferase